jgi:hypothetical protein
MPTGFQKSSATTIWSMTSSFFMSPQLQLRTHQPCNSPNYQGLHLQCNCDHDLKPTNNERGRKKTNTEVPQEDGRA